MTKSVCLFLTALALGFYPALATASEALPKVRFETSVGNIVIELYPAEAPQTVANFLRLVDDNFYASLIFHRVVANFVIQAGARHSCDQTCSLSLVRYRSIAVVLATSDNSSNE